MEIQGKIIFVLEPRKGVSQKGNSWMSQEFVIETHEQFPRKCCFSVWGEDKLKQFNIQIGEELTVSFDIDAHEYQGRWYNSLRAWKVERTPQQALTQAQPANAAQAPFAAPKVDNSISFGGNDSANDLPF